MKEQKQDPAQEPVFVPEDAGSATTIAINRQSLKQRKKSSEEVRSSSQE